MWILSRINLIFDLVIIRLSYIVMSWLRYCSLKLSTLLCQSWSDIDFCEQSICDPLVRRSWITMWQSTTYLWAPVLPQHNIPKFYLQIDAEPLKEHEAELYHILEYAKMHGLKQIKGIEDRLYGLDQLLSNAKKLERDQHDQAASLIQVKALNILIKSIYVVILYYCVIIYLLIYVQ